MLSSKIDLNKIRDGRAAGFGLRSIADHNGWEYKAVESQVRRAKKRGEDVGDNAVTAQSSKDLKPSILKALQTSKSIETEKYTKAYDVSRRVLEAVIADLQDDGFLIEPTADGYRLNNYVPLDVTEHHADWDGEKVIRFGVVSDVHTGSKYQQYTHLHAAYDLFKSEGITKVYAPGDITEGYNMRKGHEFELFLYGADEQAEYVVKHWPQIEGIETEFILGNHDHSHVKNGGTDVGKRIAMQRPDMRYLGMQEAKIFITPNCTVQLIHPLDGAAYALSYAPQKMIDSFSGGEKPSIMLMGHHHKAFYLFYRNIHAVECGTYCAQTPWMRGKRIAAMVGGWIIEAHLTEDGTITRFKPEFLPVYKPIERDY